MSYKHHWYSLIRKSIVLKFNSIKLLFMIQQSNLSMARNFKNIGHNSFSNSDL